MDINRQVHILPRNHAEDNDPAKVETLTLTSSGPSADLDQNFNFNNHHHHHHYHNHSFLELSGLSQMDFAAESSLQLTRSSFSISLDTSSMVDLEVLFAPVAVAAAVVESFLAILSWHITLWSLAYILHWSNITFYDQFHLHVPCLFQMQRPYHYAPSVGTPVMEHTHVPPQS